MDELEEITALTTKIRKMERAQEKAELELEMVKSRLKEEFEINSLDEASSLLDEMEDKLQANSKEFHKAMNVFDKAWSSFVSGLKKSP